MYCPYNVELVTTQQTFLGGGGGAIQQNMSAYIRNKMIPREEIHINIT